MPREKIIAQGAEALLIRKGKLLVKDRIKKGYRIAQLDEKLRKRRTKSEAKLLQKSAFSPKIKRSSDCSIEMDYICEKPLSETIDLMPIKKALTICREIGKAIANLHEKNIIHADLTTSNMIYKNKLFIIDFGLGYISSRIEDRAVDLHLLKQALEAKHFQRAEQYLLAIIGGYKNYDKAGLVLLQLKKVEKRGRYKRKKRKL